MIIKKIKDKRKFQGNRKLYALTKKNNNNVALYYGFELNEIYLTTHREEKREMEGKRDIWQQQIEILNQIEMQKKINKNSK